jgi:hypothetical protein
MYAGALVVQAATGWGIMQSVLIMGVTTAIITTCCPAACEATSFRRCWAPCSPR